MIRVCMDCGKEYGVKCPVCGSIGFLNPDGTYACPNLKCDVAAFERDAGGSTHGLCTTCWNLRHPDNPKSDGDEGGPSGIVGGTSRKN